jgi:putative ABC transport system permease protein
MVPVARRNLLAEKGRFAISATGVAFAVVLVVIVLGLYRGFSRTGETFQLLPGDLWMTQAGTTDPFHSLSLLQPSELDAAARIPGVKVVAPVLIRQMSFTVDGRLVNARVMAIGEADRLSLTETQRMRYAPARGEMIIDGILAAKEDLAKGQVVELGETRLTIGKVQPRSAEAFQPFAFVNYADAQRIFGVQGVVNFGLVVVEPGRDVQGVLSTLNQSGAVHGFTKDEFAQAIRQEIDNSFLPIIAIILAIGFTVGGAVVGLTLYTATVEHARDFAVMKAVGASEVFLYRIVAAQSILLTLAGFALGLAGALAVQRLAVSAVPDFSTQFRVTDILGVLAVTVAMAFAASLLPVRRISSIDPAMVFKA